MSTPIYIAWSLAVGAAIASLVIGIGLLTGADTIFRLPSPAARGRKLQRRLDLRLARGTDRYFEELRSIEAALAAHARLAPAQTGFDRAYAIVFGIAYAAFFGALAIKYTASPLLHEQPPAWSHRIGEGCLVLIGLQFALSPTDRDGESVSASRVFGIVLLILAALFLFAGFSFPGSVR